MDAIFHLSNLFIGLFVCLILFKTYLIPVIWGFKTLWGQKITMRDGFYEIYSELENKSNLIQKKKNTKMKRLLRHEMFWAPVSKNVQTNLKQYQPLETILCFSGWSRKSTSSAAQK